MAMFFLGVEGGGVECDGDADADGEDCEAAGEGDGTDPAAAC